MSIGSPDVDTFHMTHVKPHLARFAAFFLVGALVMAPLGASAAPPVVVPGDDLVAASYTEEDPEKAAKEDEKPVKEDEKAAKEDEKAVKEDEKAAKEDEKAAKEDEKPVKEDEKPVKDPEKPVKDPEKAANSGNSGNPGNGNNGNDGENGNSGTENPGNSGTSGNPGNGNNGNDGENGNSGNAGRAGVAPGLGAAPPSLTPSGVTPTQGGLGSIDARVLPVHLGAAIVIFDQNNETVTSIPEPVAPPMGMVSENLIRELAPVLPPMLVDVVAAPFVVIEALIDAMASSGQALVIPFLAGAAGLMAPGVRRKNLLAQALGQNPDSGS